MWRLDESLNVLLDGLEPAVLALASHATETTHHFYAIETNHGCTTFIPVASYMLVEFSLAKEQREVSRCEEGFFGFLVFFLFATDTPAAMLRAAS